MAAGESNSLSKAASEALLLFRGEKYVEAAVLMEDIARRHTDDLKVLPSNNTHGGDTPPYPSPGSGRGSLVETHT